MSLPEGTLEELARLAREDEASLKELPAELSAPLSADKTTALIDSIQARLAPPRRTSNPVPLVRRSRSVAVGGAAIAALAAGVLFWVGPKPDAGAPLPVYEVRVQGGQRSERSSAHEVGPLRLRPGSKLSFELRPNQDFTEPVSARVVLTHAGKDGESLELEVVQERSAAGALKVEARLPTWLPERGELLLLVGRRSSEEGARRFPWQFERSP